MVDNCIAAFLFYFIQKAEQYIDYVTASIVGERSQQYIFKVNLLGNKLCLYNVELSERALLMITLDRP